jgi:hypothetical protein
MPTVITQGAASAKGYGFGASSAAVNYIEDVFSTYLYTGNGSTQTITNGIDLSGKGGLTWIKDRTIGLNHALFDTARGVTQMLQTDNTGAQSAQATSLTAFNSNGFTTGSNVYTNNNTTAYASWTFRKQAKFFDVVTYTGNGANRTISHNLGSVPGSIFVKRTDTTAAWAVYHRSLANTQYLVLNDTAAAATGATYWNSTTPTSSVFSLGTATDVNANGGTYVAYLFAHDAGGFGATGTDNVISCGSYTGNGSATGPVITLGYEPQWLLVKRTSVSTGSWRLMDNMRGNSYSSQAILYANAADAENPTSEGRLVFTATGFQPIYGGDADLNANGSTYIYIAIRRGPMKTPTTGTSVFALSTWTGSAGNKDFGSQTAGFGSGYMSILKSRTAAQTDGVFDQLRGKLPFLATQTTDAEANDPAGISIVNNQLQLNSGSYFGAGGDGSGQSYIGWNFRRAPGFFDVVCYTGTGTTASYNHNLGVTPELIIKKCRSTTSDWAVYSAALGSGYNLRLQLVNAAAVSGVWGTPTSTTFTTNNDANTQTFVAYLFATVAGVSKVGSYTGTGTTKQIDCGFTGGARFVLIKRTDSTGDWYVWDSARGIVSGNDPYLLLNSTAAEVTSTDYVDTYSAGFEISSTAPAAINANGGSFVYLAIS